MVVSEVTVDCGVGVVGNTKYTLKGKSTLSTIIHDQIPQSAYDNVP